MPIVTIAAKRAWWPDEFHGNFETLPVQPRFTAELAQRLGKSAVLSALNAEDDDGIQPDEVLVKVVHLNRWSYGASDPEIEFQVPGRTYWLFGTWRAKARHARIVRNLRKSVEGLMNHYWFASGAHLPARPLYTIDVIPASFTGVTVGDGRERVW